MKAAGKKKLCYSYLHPTEHPLSHFTINSFVRAHKHPYTHICFIYTSVSGFRPANQAIKCTIFFQSTQTRIMRYYILEKAF